MEDGDPFPQLLPAQDSFVVENIFTDLKRHALGLAFEERNFDGTRLVEQITEPLWGVATTAPYGHDGRSVNLDQVIRRHGGEAQGVTDSYVDLTEDQQAKILEFLNTLVLFRFVQELRAGPSFLDKPICTCVSMFCVAKTLCVIFSRGHFLTFPREWP